MRLKTHGNNQERQMMKKKQHKWEVVGYYFDGQNTYTLLEDEHGNSKRVRGIK